MLDVLVPTYNSDSTTMGDSDGVYPEYSYIDLDTDYDDMMTKALRSYSVHRAREKADSRHNQLRINLRPHYHRPWTAPDSRDLLPNGGLPGSVRMPKVDAIREVQRANDNRADDDYDDDDRRPRRVLQLATVNLNMIQQQTKKVACHKKRNEPAHPWFSHSYPSVPHIQRFTRAPHAYMTASVGERELSSALSRSCSASTSKSSSKSGSRSSSTKRSPQHVHYVQQVRAAGTRPQSAAVKSNKYYYDGGLFTQARNAPKDYFVIHPDWVSESMTVQKLSLADRNKLSATSTVSKTGNLPERRCKSAPPSKLRNPITWEAYNS